MTLSSIVWQQNQAIINAIINMPFNQELMKGTLNKQRFNYYLEQDSLYLQDFSRAHAIIASKIEAPLIQTFLKFAEETFIAEQELVHHYFRNKFGFSNSHQISPATLSYTSYLLKTCYTRPVEEAIAAVLPCFWVYHEVGLHLAKYSIMDNPYSRWIETYSSDAFKDSVNNAIDIFDNLATKASEQTRQNMVIAFNNSTCLEWHFWNDAYQLKTLDPTSPQIENRA